VRTSWTSSKGRHGPSDLSATAQTEENRQDSTYAPASHRGIGATAVPGFIASPALAASLQALLVDLIELHPQAKQTHWNVVDHNFRDLHLQPGRDS
jgi:hypothetical protein